MKRRDFIKHSLLTSAAFYAACGSNVKNNKRKIKVVLIGIDGANWPTLDPLMEKGKLPFWKQLKSESAWAYLKTFKPTKSSVVWTSIATGKSMQKHGILDFTFLDKNNIQVPYSNMERREPAIWQILDEYSKKAIVINWFVSHPPDKIDGIMISDNFRRVVARPEEKVEDYKDSVHPTIYFHKLLELAEKDYHRVFRKTGLPDYPKLYTDLHPGMDFKDVPIMKTYRSLATQDNFVSTISENLFRTKDFDFFATYIRMPDLVQHFSARMFEDKYTEELVAALKNNTLTEEKHREAILKIADIIEPAYRFSEQLLKSLLDYKKYEDAYFIIVSDHGFTLYPGGYNHYGLPDEYEAPPGIMMIKGPKVIKGQLESASVYDIAPTILHLFDYPIGKNMDGKPLVKAFDFNRKLTYKTYKLDQREKRRTPNKADEEAIKELKSIGYI
jgi:predicted AlkP superfamily phosphohydrolase/phosphomutase